MSCKTNIGLLLLRLSTGGLMLFHGVAKLQGGLGFLQGMHLGDLCAINPQTGGWAVELPMLYLLSSLALVFTGGGRFAVSNKTWLD